MDLLEAKELYYNNKSNTHAFFNGVMVWSKYNEEFTKDFKNLTEIEEWGGMYDTEKKGLVI